MQAVIHSPLGLSFSLLHCQGHGSAIFQVFAQFLGKTEKLNRVAEQEAVGPAAVAV